MKTKTTLDNPWTFRILLLLAFAIVIFNLLFTISTALGTDITGMFGSPSTSTETTPGAMLPYGVTFDNSGYEKLFEYYRTITLDSLTSEQKQRFISIGTREKTGCGPCCGIQNDSGIDSSGNARCGCGHNLALIGLMKHLVKNYGDKYTDDQIFNEIVKMEKIIFPRSGC